MRKVILAALWCGLAACADSGTATDEAMDARVEADGSMPDTNEADSGGEDAGGPEVDVGSDAQPADADAPMPDPDVEGSAEPELVNEVPVEGEALNAWLQTGSYLDYPAEAEVHRSSGPHGAGVRTFFNPILDRATRAGLTEWPVGSAAIKELYDSGGNLDGWAVEVKVNEDSSVGTLGGGWYWYEVLSTDPSASPVADGTGVRLCAGCHSGGVDFMTTPFPLP